jgi:hypothetical protein
VEVLVGQEFRVGSSVVVRDKGCKVMVEVAVENKNALWEKVTSC